MYKSILISILSSVLLFVGCKEDHEKPNWTEVTVTCTNPVTNQPIDSLIMTIYVIRQGFGLNSETSIEYQSYLENGYQSYAWLAEKKSKYAYQFYGSMDITKYYPVKYPEFAYLDKGEEHFFDFEITEYTYFIFGLHNQNCFDSNDEITVSLSHLEIPNYNGWATTTWAGCVNFDGTVVNEIPMGTYVWNWSVTKNDTTNYYTDTVFFHPGDTTTYTINY